jgi:hypothetical protein
MVNLLAFREHADGDFEGRSGRDAYEQYARSVGAIQGSMGSKLLWSGDVASAGDDRPPFEAAALLQYASPRSFLRFVVRGGSDTAARKAGLAGQWLLAAQTVDSAPWEVGHEAALIELVSLGGQGQAWLAARRKACTGLDGELIWRGRCTKRLIGSGPRIDEVWVTGFANDSARSAGVEAISDVARETGVETWWAYKAEGTDILPELRG